MSDKEQSTSDLAKSIANDTKTLAEKGINQAKEKIKTIDSNKVKNTVVDGVSNIKEEVSGINWNEMFKPLETKILLGLVIAFFLPWVSFGPISASGFSIPGTIQDFLNLSRAFNPNADTPFILHYYLLFLIPIGGISSAWFHYSKNITKAKISGLVASGVFLLFFIGALIKGGTDVFDAMSFGSLASLLLSLAFIVVTFRLHEKLKKSP